MGREFAHFDAVPIQTHIALSPERPVWIAQADAGDGPSVRIVLSCLSALVFLSPA